MYQRVNYKVTNALRAVRSWVVPFAISRIKNKELRPILCFLYTEGKCNINCHYCFQYNNDEAGMTFEIACSSIDWLDSLGCRVLALMGGEPLVRKDFVLDVFRYSSAKGFFNYLPTNGYLLDNDYIDELGTAGMSVINLAVDCVKAQKGLPKALLSIEPQFRYLVERQVKHNYIIIFNINLCSTNIKDARLLTDIALQNNIAIDFHLTEEPHEFVNIDHYNHLDNHLWIREENKEEVDDFLDWIIDKHHQGKAILNSVEHLEAFKSRAGGTLAPWDCRAGQNGLLIRQDGSLAPCFDLIGYSHDWGRIWAPDFDKEALASVKTGCMPNCSSTCFHTMASYYQFRNVGEWIHKFARTG